LEELHGRPDLIRQALTLLSRHLIETADDAKDHDLVEALTVKNTLDDPLSLLQDYLSFQGVEEGRRTPRYREEAEWVATAWLVPWEHARQDRIFRVMFDGDQKHLHWIISRAEDLGPLSALVPHDMTNIHRSRQRSLCAARAMQLKLALRWYQADNGKPAENLDELVPKYLPSIPLDPYDGAPFRYRLSRGEEIEWPADSNVTPPAEMPMGVEPPPAPHTREIPAGQGVLWSVGEDKLDNGGHRQSGSLTGQAAAGEDMIFLVPLPPQAK
jgi:hypothetical protein